MTEPTLEIPGFEQFTLLARGGFSRVWKAFQPRFERHVAIKVLSFDIVDAKAIKTFERECRAMGQVSGHPNIVTVLDSGLTTDHRPFIAMALFEGGTYADKMRTGVLDVAEVLHVGVKIASALETAHRVDILHRDIKPLNIFIDKYGQPALGDFGISSVDDERTATGGAGLTLHYAAPEILNGKAASPQSDLYSLGATLFALLAGKRPFDAGTSEELTATALRIINDPAPRIERSDVPVSLRRLVGELMAKTAAERPASAAEVAERLRQIEGDLGLAPTDIILEATAVADDTFAAQPDPSVPSIGSIGDGRSDSVTIASPRQPEPGAPAEDERPPLRRRLQSAVAVVLAVGLVAVLAVWALAEDDGAITPPDTTEFAQADTDLLSLPVRPTGAKASFVSDHVIEISWSPTAEDDATFRIRRTDSDDEPVIVDMSPAIIEGITTSNACFEVSMERGGRLSQASETVCASR